MALTSASQCNSKRVSHNKVRSGCVTCKKRRIKCDETKPHCGRCKQARKHCGGYNTPKAWLFEPHSKSGADATTALPNDEGTRLRTMEYSSLSRDKYRPTSDARNADSLHYYNSLSTLATFARMYMPYLEETYAGDNRGYISSLFHFTMFHYGPTFCWRPHTDQYEQERFSDKFVRWFLHEPALTEAMLAAAQRQLELESGQSQQDPMTLSHYHHYGKSISALRRRISQASAVFDEAVFWAIVALLVSDQEKDDWDSFAVNLGGLRRIVDLRGGPNALGTYSDRAYVFYSWAEACYANHDAWKTPGTTETKAGESPSSSTKLSSTPSSDLHHRVQYFPEGFRRMVSAHEFDLDTVAIIDRTVQWFHAHTSAMGIQGSPDGLSKERASLADELCHLIHRPAFSKQERLVCVGLFALTLSLHPNYMYEQYPGTLDGYVLHHLDNIDDEMLASESCVLWVALIVASMQVCFRLSREARWGLLNRVVERPKMTRQWSEVRDTVRGFCFIDPLEVQWEACWRFATRRLLPKKG